MQVQAGSKASSSAFEHSGQQQKAFATLCTPSRLGKRLPLVLHCGDNCLYEEPCLLAFDLYIAEVRGTAEAGFCLTGRKC